MGELKVTDLINRKSKSNSNVRFHPDFPGDDEMKQYRCHEYSRVNDINYVQRTRSMHWSGMVSGELAIDMAKNLENLFRTDDTVVAPIVDAVPAGRGGGRGGGRRAAGRGNAKPKTGVSAKQFAQDWAKQAMNWSSILKDCKAKLACKPWAGDLAKQMETGASDFDTIHEGFIKTSEGLSSSPMNADTSMTIEALQDPVSKYNFHAKRCREYVEAADSMCGGKNTSSQVSLCCLYSRLTPRRPLRRESMLTRMSLPFL